MKLVLILPYFGTLKNYFDLFLKTLSYNDNVDLLLITDNDMSGRVPGNVRVINMSFDEFRDRIQSKFDFEISLKNPYKLCDYKPTYGYICEEWIEKYDYWGYCDCDMLLGDLTPLMSLLEKNYDKLFVAGHLTIYKNTKDNNRIFMSKHPEHGCLYKVVYSNENIYAFDEVYFKLNVNTLFELNNKSIFEEDLSYNSSTRSSMLSRETFEPKSRKWIPEKGINDQIYWEKGHLFRVNYHGLKRQLDEYLYIHLQLRKMDYKSNVLNSDVIRVLPNKFEASKNIPQSYLQFLLSQRLFLNIEVIKARFFSWIYRNHPGHIKYSRPWEYDPYQ